MPNLHYALLVADAMGLGLFAIAGAQAVESQGHAWIVLADETSRCAPILGIRNSYVGHRHGSIVRHSLQLAIAGIGNANELVRLRGDVDPSHGLGGLRSWTPT